MSRLCYLQRGEYVKALKISNKNVASAAEYFYFSKIIKIGGPKRLTDSGLAAFVTLAIALPR